MWLRFCRNHHSFGIIYAMCYGPEAALFCDLFDARVRYTGISFVYQFSGIFASGITPIIATYLIAANGNKLLTSSLPRWSALRASVRTPQAAAPRAAA